MPIRTAAALGISHLYHYQSFNDAYLREIIVDGVIHFSKPGDFNDPWDCRPWFDFECLTEPKMVEHHVQWYIDVSGSKSLSNALLTIGGTRMSSQRKFVNSPMRWLMQLTHNIAFIA